VSRKIFVIYPEEIKEKPEEMMFARKQLGRTEIDLSQIENDLKNVIAMFENLEGTDSKYGVDEAKLTVGLIKDEEGKLQASIAGGFLSLFKGAIGGEAAEKTSENRLFEIVIKRKP
jgi:seryl-tRNA synthetase